MLITIRMNSIFVTKKLFDFTSVEIFRWVPLMVALFNFMPPFIDFILHELSYVPHKILH